MCSSDLLRRALFVARHAKWSWLRAVEEDFNKLRLLSKEFEPYLSFTSWIADIRLRHTFWKDLVKKLEDAGCQSARNLSAEAEESIYRGGGGAVLALQCLPGGTAFHLGESHP